MPQEFVDAIKKIGVKSEKADLLYGDFAFEGNGPDGPVTVGIERKSLHDMLNCIDDGRLSGHQLVGMRKMYDPVPPIVLLEGHWRPHDPNGMLMEGFNGGYSWGPVRHRKQGTMYHKLYRYLISMSLSGVIITPSRDIFHSAFNVCEWYQYFQKRWLDHTSMQEMHTLAIPALNGKPPLVRKWANDLTDIGTKLSADAERMFKKPIALANADEQEWLRIPGVGVKTAQQIVREVWGLK